MQPKLIAAALAALLATSIANGQAANPDARVSLRVPGRPLADVVAYLQSQSGANIVVKQGADKLVTLDLTDVPWRAALDIAAHYAGCVVEDGPAGVLIIDNPPRVEMTIEEPQDIRAVINLIGLASGANIMVAPEVTGSLTLRLKGVPWRDALEVAAKTLGFVVVEDRAGILRVVDPATLQAQLETRSYQLRYIRPPGRYVPVIESEFVTTTQKIQAQQQKGGANQDPAKKLPIFEPLMAALSEGGALDYVEKQNVLIIRDTAQVHETIGQILDRLDVEPSQIFVDVKFVSTTNGDLFSLGVDYGEAGPQVSISGSAIPITLPFNLGSGGFEDSIIANDSGVGPFVDPTLNQVDVLAPSTTFGSLSFTGVAATLRMLQRDTKSEVVQAPRLMVLDGHEGTIFVGETVRYAEAKTEQGQSGGLSLAITEASNSPVDIGFQLLVKPNVIPGTNKLSMDVIPKETSLSGTGESDLAPAGFDVYTIGASGLEGSIALPRKRSSTIVTSMLLESGQTAMIGGLTTESDVETDNKIPLLGDIPVLGYLFKHKEQSRERRSLVVFVTPTIVRSSFDQERIIQEELAVRRKLYESELEEVLHKTSTTTSEPTGGVEISGSTSGK